MTSNGTGSSNRAEDAQAAAARQAQRKKTIAALQTALAQLGDVQAMLGSIGDRVSQIEARRGVHGSATPLAS